MVKEDLVTMGHDELVDMSMRLEKEREKLEQESNQYKNWWRAAEARLESMQRKLKLLQELIESWN